MCENASSGNKCLCAYCSGSIAHGMHKMNQEDVKRCEDLVDQYLSGHKNVLNDLNTRLEAVNPVQCFDILDKLCAKSTNDGEEIDSLIMKFIRMHRSGGGFFLALENPKSPARRQNLLNRLIHTTLNTHKEEGKRLNVQSSDLELHQAALNQNYEQIIDCIKNKGAKLNMDDLELLGVTENIRQKLREQSN
ncbi:unnamed protein product [Didymodactylos carnosus]|uniref:Uncharacterized protein n=1 Tax=Didymodactylos carnosus TaxID=1234261 RepID=A0A813P1H2_9BILA|nr:unnamed protein product [Didymodactylos carnosus]CAF1036930.1 unnamed protein product [Didymodactylos carnosus]CAF3527580.1 unnamed protein product [Didymodactylos carnosus]CAF3805127.1 unnamed protein product [Didymodactylos carnosus]